MAKYKYPAPFDVETPVDLLSIPNVPLPPSPPLPVSIPVDKPEPPGSSGLYQELMGDDLSLVYLALDAPWASIDQQLLAEQIASGQKNLHSLSTADQELLNDLVHRFNDQGGQREDVLSELSERLRIPDEEDDEREDDEDVQSESESDLQPDIPEELKDAYSWTEGEEGGE